MSHPLERFGIEPDPIIELYKKDVDRTLLRENLKLSVEQRFRKLQAMARWAEEVRRDREQARKLRDDHLS